MPLTLEDIAALINTNKEEIITKVDAIVEDIGGVKTQVNNLVQKAERQEENNIEMEDRFLILEKEIQQLKKPSLPVATFAQIASAAPHPAVVSSLGAKQRETETVNENIRKIISDGKRVIGISPVDQNDIDIAKEKGIEGDKEATEAAAKYFFAGEMNVPESTLERMKIVRVFRPFNNENNNKLYVEFETENSVSILNRYKRNLPVDCKVSLWFPPAIYPRYKALDDMSYQLRKVILPYHQTDIRYEANDIVLYKRLNKFKRWEKVIVDNLPEVILQVTPSLTPAQGRIRISSAKRNRSNSMEENTQAKKTQRISVDQEEVEEKNEEKTDDKLEIAEEDTEVKDDAKAATKPDLVVKDAGKFTEHHSYSPARPAPSKHSLITTTPGQIPVMKQTKLVYKPRQLPVKINQMDFQ